MADARLSQFPVEVLLGNQPAPSARVSQVPVDVLRGNQPVPAASLSQLPIEVLRASPTKNFRASHLVIEALITETVPSAGLRFSHIVIEALGNDTAQPPPLRASHVVVDALVTDAALLFLRLSHLVADVLVTEPPAQEEAYFDPDEAPIGLTWIEFIDSDGELHVWSNLALPDPATYFGGFKEHRVIEFNSIRRGLSNIDGVYEGIIWSWTLSG